MNKKLKKWTREQSWRCPYCPEVRKTREGLNYHVLFECTGHLPVRSPYDLSAFNGLKHSLEDH